MSQGTYHGVRSVQLVHCPEAGTWGRRLIHGRLWLSLHYCQPLPHPQSSSPRPWQKQKLDLVADDSETDCYRFVYTAVIVSCYPHINCLIHCLDESWNLWRMIFRRTAIISSMLL